MGIIRGYKYKYSNIKHAYISAGAALVDIEVVYCKNSMLCEHIYI
jgi:hypothetical protein